MKISKKCNDFWYCVHGSFDYHLFTISNLKNAIEKEIKKLGKKYILSYWIVRVVNEFHIYQKIHWELIFLNPSLFTSKKKCFGNLILPKQKRLDFV